MSWLRLLHLEFPVEQVGIAGSLTSFSQVGQSAFSDTLLLGYRESWMLGGTP